MEVTETQAEGLKREFKVIVPSGDMEKQVDMKLKELCATVRLPGFRPGHVPMSLVRGKYGQSVLAEIVQKTLTDTAKKLLKARNLRPAMQPHAEITAFPDGKDLEFTLTVELVPEIAFMDFSKIEIERLEPIVSEEDVAKALENAAASQRRFQPIAKARPAQEGDLVVIDFLGRVDGKPFEGGAAQGHQLELGSGRFIPGFEEQLIGAEAGGSVVVVVSFPDPYPSKELAGKEAHFDVTVQEVRERVPVGVDDALAKAFGVETLDELRKEMRESLEREYKNVAYVREKRECLDALAEGHPFDLPQGAVDAEFESIWAQIKERRGHTHDHDHDHDHGHDHDHDHDHGHAQEDEFEGKDDETLKKEYRAIAERRVRLGLLLSEVGSKNSISLSQKDINDAIGLEARSHPGHEAQVFEFYQQNSEALQRLLAPLFEDKVVRFLLEKVQIKVRNISPDELINEVQATMEKMAGKKEKSAKPGKPKTAAAKAKKKAVKKAKS